MKGIFAKPQPDGGSRDFAEGVKPQHGDPSLKQNFSRRPTHGPTTRARDRMGFLTKPPEHYWHGGRVLYVLNDLLYTANIPSSIDRGIAVLLPKVPAPLEWGETRPITPSSTMLKWAAQLLMGRGGHQIRHGATLQWARKGRQGIELIATLRRVTTMARDWGVGTYIVKLDIRKAFDSVWQHSMSELVAARVCFRAVPSPTGRGGPTVGSPTLAQHSSDAQP